MRELENARIYAEGRGAGNDIRTKQNVRDINLSQVRMYVFKKIKGIIWKHR